MAFLVSLFFAKKVGDHTEATDVRSEDKRVFYAHKKPLSIENRQRTGREMCVKITQTNQFTEFIHIAGAHITEDKQRKNTAVQTRTHQFPITRSPGLANTETAIVIISAYFSFQIIWGEKSLFKSVFLHCVRVHVDFFFQMMESQNQ